MECETLSYRRPHAPVPYSEAASSQHRALPLAILLLAIIRVYTMTDTPTFRTSTICP